MPNCKAFTVFAATAALGSLAALGAASPPNSGCGALAAGGAAAIAPVVVSDAARIRVVAFGDFGTGAPEQRAVAAAIAAQAASEPFDLGLTLGDNFYEDGLASAADPRWKSQWEEPYGRLDIRFFATFGNHDVHSAASREAELAYSAASRSWCLPRAYYTFVAGPVQFFALDTNALADGAADPDQLAWLDRALTASHSPWTVVYGHHPIYSNGHHGDSAALKSALLDLLARHHVDVYLAGHDHDMQELAPEKGVRFLVAGGGGKPPRPLTNARCRIWAEPANGFLALSADATSLAARFVGTAGQTLHEARWQKGQPLAECRR